MSAARDLANFLAGVTARDLPPQTLDHAAMLIASTIASAAMGSGLESAGIIKDMARSLGAARALACGSMRAPNCRSSRRRRSMR